MTPKKEVLILHLIPERWIVSVFAELISRPLSAAEHVGGCWMMQASCYPRRKFHFPIFTLERLWTVPAAWEWRFFGNDALQSYSFSPPPIKTSNDKTARVWKEKGRSSCCEPFGVKRAECCDVPGGLMRFGVLPLLLPPLCKSCTFLWTSPAQHGCWEPLWRRTPFPPSGEWPCTDSPPHLTSFGNKLHSRLPKTQKRWWLWTQSDTFHVATVEGDFPQNSCWKASLVPPPALSEGS